MNEVTQVVLTLVAVAKFLWDLHAHLRYKWVLRREDDERFAWYRRELEDGRLDPSAHRNLF